MTTAGVVLAAGAGRRFGGGKLRAEVDGQPLVARAVDAARGARLAAVYVVTGADDLADLLPDDVVPVANPDWATGQASSLQAGVRAAGDDGHDAVVVGLADQPGVGSAAWAAVAGVDAPLATATYGGRRSPPVRLAEVVWPLLPRSGDAGARVLLRARPDLVTEVPCPGDPVDVDTREDLDRWS